MANLLLSRLPLALLLLVASVQRHRGHQGSHTGHLGHKFIIIEMVQRTDKKYLAAHLVDARGGAEPQQHSRVSPHEGGCTHTSPASRLLPGDQELDQPGRKEFERELHD